MAETSYWWTTTESGEVGDQVASHTQGHLAQIAKTLAACHGFEGVAQNFGGSMNGTVTGANTVQIGAGGAVVDGHVYRNTAAVEINIPSAVGGGNTRIDRIVLRADWAAYTIRLTRIEGIDAASPTAPAITQISGTTYDVLLYQALVNASGDVTLTDERTSAGLITWRQGGGANRWDTAGTTNRSIGSACMQAGSVQLASELAANGGTVDFVITFPEAYDYEPLVLVTPKGTLAGYISAGTLAVTTTGATISVVNNHPSTGITPVLFWIAIGPGV